MACVSSKHSMFTMALNHQDCSFVTSKVVLSPGVTSQLKTSSELLIKTMLVTAWCCSLILTSWASTETYWRQQGTALHSSQPPLRRTIPTKHLGENLRLSSADEQIPAIDESEINPTIPSSAEGVSDSKIIGGRQARTGEFPWIVSLSWLGGMHFCGGSLLTLRHVLTACHCTCRYKDDSDEDLINVEDFTMNAGSIFSQKSYSRGSTLQERPPLKFQVHPSCRSRRRGGYLFDYAIVQPKKPFISSPTLNVMKLISLNKGATWKYLTTLVKNRRWCKAVGWGTTGIARGTYVNVSDALRVVGVQLISFAKCHELLRNFSGFYKTVNLQTRYQVCAKNDNRSDACKGDSGGGFVCGSFVFGLLSWGPSCGEKNTPSMYASIDGGWDFIVKSVVSLTTRVLTSVRRLLAAGAVVLIINRIRNI